MVAPRGRALVFLNIGCGRRETATSGHRAWGSRRRAGGRTSPPDVIGAMHAQQTHVHSWGGRTGGLNEERAALFSLHSNCSSTRSLGIALKMVDKEDTTKPTVYRGRSFQNREEVWGRSFPKSAGRSGECLGKDFKLFGESLSVRGSPIIKVEASLLVISLIFREISHRGDNVQGFDTTWAEVLLSMKKIAEDGILDILFKMRLREFQND